MFWVDTLKLLGEFDTAVGKLLQARDLFNDEYEIEYRLAGLYTMTNQTEKALYHLTNALSLNFVNRFILERLFPSVWENEGIQNHIKKFHFKE